MRSTETTWMRLGATRMQARQLQAIQNVEWTSEEVGAALRSGRATNMWSCAIRWLNDGQRVVADDNMFYLDLRAASVPSRDEGQER